MKKINESFVCISCWKEIQKANKTCRNHCPYCFVSLHVDDVLPWDRLAQCKWLMYPISYIIKNWNIKIAFKCKDCWKIHHNNASDDDEIWNLDQHILNYKIIFMIP